AADLNQRAADGFLINGSSNNGASSPFGMMPAFGNNRRGPRSLYNGNIGISLDNSSLDARAFSLTGQDTPKPDYNRLTGLFSFDGGATYNYQIPIVGNIHQDSLQTRLNKGIGRKNQLSGSFAYQSTRSDTPNVFGFLDVTNSSGINAQTNWRHTFTPRFFGNL